MANSSISHGNAHLCLPGPQAPLVPCRVFYSQDYFSTGVEEDGTFWTGEVSLWR